MDCPEIRELAAFVESQEAPAVLRHHVERCDACQDALKTLEEEVLSLQIPLSEIWFREHISCPHTDVLVDYRHGKLTGDLQEYVKFHVEDLECAWCQGRLGEVEVATTRDGRRGVTRSRKRVGEATSVLLDELRRAKR
jgi:hypothetical protein